MSRAHGLATAAAALSLVLSLSGAFSVENQAASAAVPPTSGPIGALRPPTDAHISLVHRQGVLPVKRIFAGDLSTLRVHVLGRDGLPPGDATVEAIDLAGGATYYQDVTAGVAELSLPSGRYSVGTVLAASDSVTMAYDADLEISGDREAVLDARTAQPVTTTLDDPTARTVMTEVFLLQRSDAGLVQFPQYSVTSDEGTPVYVTPTGPADADLQVHTVWTKNGTDANSPYLYSVLSTSASGIPRRPTYRIRTSDLAKVRTTYAAQGTPASAAQGAAAAPDGQFVGAYARAIFTVGVHLPAVRTEYYTPGAVDWDQLMFIRAAPGQADAMTGVVRYTHPARYTSTWDAAPLGPGFDFAPTRTGDDLFVGASMFTDSAGHTNADTRYLGTTGTTSLYRDGRLIATSNTPGALNTALTPEPAAYRLTAELHRQVSYSRYSVRERVVWNFRSRHEAKGGTSLPLLVVRATPRLDRYGRSPAGRPCTVRFALKTTADSPAAVSVRLRAWASYDDGASWHSARLMGTGNNRHATIRPPAYARFVSLRTSGRDTAGNSVDQTVIRAWGVKH